MSRHTLLPTLGLLALSALACGGNKTPKPWVKREGQREVVGNPNDVDHSLKTGEDGPASQRGGNLGPSIRVEDPEVGTNLPEVADSYEALAEKGQIEACPEGTGLVDDRKDHGEMFCTLPDGPRHGPFMAWHPSGPIKEIGPYVGGKRQGTWVTWDRKGKKYSTYQWEDGAPVSGEVYK